MASTSEVSLEELLARVARQDPKPARPSDPTRTEVTVKGVLYPSMRAAARAHGIPDEVFVSRFYKSKWSLERAATTPVRHGTSFKWDGETHTISTWARMYGLSAHVLRKRLARGWSIRDALTHETREVQLRGAGAAAREMVISAKKWPCKDCGEKFPAEAMDLDHVRGTKLFELSQIKGRTLEEIRVEIEKCEPVCAVCHRQRTAARRAT